MLLFFLLTALWMPVRQIWLIARGQSNRKPWSTIGTQIMLAIGTILLLGATLLGVSFALSPITSNLIKVVVISLLTYVLTGLAVALFGVSWLHWLFTRMPRAKGVVQPKPTRASPLVISPIDGTGVLKKIVAPFERNLFRMSILNVLLFALIWLAVGYSTGFSTLVGPVRWITNLARDNGWGQSEEDAAVKLIIVAFVLVSALASLFLTRSILRSPAIYARVGIPMLCGLALFGTVWLTLSPELLTIGQGAETTFSTQFTFGSYPTEERLLRLKQEGYTAVVSLLHPAIVPFEPKLLADEQRAAQRVGLEFIHIPMLPWVGENKESLERLKGLANRDGGRYYIHCYLGKDRTRLAQRIIESVAPPTVTNALLPGRNIETRDRFERGEVIRLGEQVYLTPYPTDEEFASYILGGNFNQVVSLLDPETPSDSFWIKREKQVLESYSLPLESLPITANPYDPYQVLAAAYRVAALPRPVVVHAFRSDSFRAQAFVQAFTTNLPPLPPALFEEPMERGKVTVIAPNVATGPRPTGPEFESYLHWRGIRNYVYLGSSKSPEAEEDREATQEAGYHWEAVDPTATDPEDLYERMATGGSWYLYGPSLSTVQKRLVSQRGPAVPKRLLRFPNNEAHAALLDRLTHRWHIVEFRPPPTKLFELPFPLLLLKE